MFFVTKNGLKFWPPKLKPPKGQSYFYGLFHSSLVLIIHHQTQLLAKRCNGVMDWLLWTLAEPFSHLCCLMAEDVCNCPPLVLHQYISIVWMPSTKLKINFNHLHTISGFFFKSYLIFWDRNGVFHYNPINNFIAYRGCQWAFVMIKIIQSIVFP